MLYFLTSQFIFYSQSILTYFKGTISIFFFQKIRSGWISKLGSQQNTESEAALVSDVLGPLDTAKFQPNVLLSQAANLRELGVYMKQVKQNKCFASAATYGHVISICGSYRALASRKQRWRTLLSVVLGEENKTLEVKRRNKKSPF